MDRLGSDYGVYYICPKCGALLTKLDYKTPKYDCNYCKFLISIIDPKFKDLKKISVI
jgi:DNA-directed RNA polymerase subunit RPC12/RpoP